MDDGGLQENGRHRIDIYKGALWNNMISQYQLKDQNAFIMSRKISMIYAERNAAIEQRDQALFEKKAALDERDTVIQQRDAAIAERNCATKERDNALAALQFRENAMNCTFSGGIQCGTKSMQCPTNHPAQVSCKICEVHIADVFPISAIASDAVKSRQVSRTNGNKVGSSRLSKPPIKRKKVGKDLNRHVTADESKWEWNAEDNGLMNHVTFDESDIPAPVCSCTGGHRQCYKWSNGGWQSSCCTNTLSLYPLPRRPNKRHTRIGGRKMSGSVFSRLLGRLAATGHDLSVPVDLKNYWAKHGTNRYMTIK